MGEEYPRCILYLSKMSQQKGAWQPCYRRPASPSTSHKSIQLLVDLPTVHQNEYSLMLLFHRQTSHVGTLKTKTTFWEFLWSKVSLNRRRNKFSQLVQRIRAMRLIERWSTRNWHVDLEKVDCTDEVIHQPRYETIYSSGSSVKSNTSSTCTQANTSAEPYSGIRLLNA